jgi:hypothetical protein
VVPHTRCAVVRERGLSSGRVGFATGSYLGLEFCRLLALGLDKKTWTVEETAQKKKDSKQKRKEKAAEKAAAILKGAGSAEWRVAAELQEAAAAEAEAEDAEDEEAAAEEAEADDMNDG